VQSDATSDFGTSRVVSHLQIIVRLEIHLDLYSWSQDGRFILYDTGISTPGTGHDVWVLPLFNDRKPFPFVKTDFQERSTADGKKFLIRVREAKEEEPSITLVVNWPMLLSKQR